MEDATKQTTTNVVKQPTQHTIRYLLDGFPVETTCYGQFESLQGVINKLRAANAQPLVTGAGLTASAAKEKPEADKKPPKCPTHKIPMKPSKKRGQSWFCPKRDEDGSYCEEYE